MLIYNTCWEGKANGVKNCQGKLVPRLRLLELSGPVRVVIQLGRRVTVVTEKPLE